MIFNFMSTLLPPQPLPLSELADGEYGVVRGFGLPEQVAEHLMNLGFVPGVEVVPTRSGPGGDPRVYRVDGNEVALRRDVSRGIEVCRAQAPGAKA